MLCLVTKTKLRVVRELTEEEADAIRDPLLGDSTRELALAVLREGRENDLWLRCDCRIDIDDYPLVAPCRMPEGAGYSWRVLQGENRPQHHPDCVFYRESREERAERELAPGGAGAAGGVFCGVASPQGRRFGGVGYQRGRHGADRPPPGAWGRRGQGTGSAADAGIAGAPVPAVGDGRAHGGAGERACTGYRWVDGSHECRGADNRGRARTPLGRAPVSVAHGLGPAARACAGFGRPGGTSRRATCRRGSCAFRYSRWESGPYRRPASMKSWKWSLGSGGRRSAGAPCRAPTCSSAWWR